MTENKENDKDSITSGEEMYLDAKELGDLLNERSEFKP